MPWAVTRVNRGTVVGRTLGLESDDTEELRMPECVRIADRHEHTADVELVYNHPYFFQSCQKAHWVLGDWFVKNVKVSNQVGCR